VGSNPTFGTTSRRPAGIDRRQTDSAGGLGGPGDRPAHPMPSTRSCRPRGVRRAPGWAMRAPSFQLWPATPTAERQGPSRRQKPDWVPDLVVVHVHIVDKGRADPDRRLAAGHGGRDPRGEPGDYVQVAAPAPGRRPGVHVDVRRLGRGPPSSCLRLPGWRSIPALCGQPSERRPGVTRPASPARLHLDLDRRAVDPDPMRGRL
jgi:hypothetical protein